MKLKAPSFNSGLIKTNLKRFWWMPALMTIYMFLMLPMSVINQIRYDSFREGVQYMPYIEIFESIMEGHGAVYGIAFPIIAGCFLLSYLHKVNSVSVFHSLPYTRESLYMNAFLSGAVMIAIPMIVNAVALFILMPFGGNMAAYNAFDVLKICGHYFLFSFIQLALCFLVGMFTGNFFAHGAFAVIVNFLPIIIYYLTVAVLKIFLRGFAGESDRVYDFLEQLPALKVFDPFDMSGAVFLAYIIAFIALVALGIYCYKKRPLEKAGDIITFKFFKPVFKYGLTACTMVCGYLVFEGDRKEISGIFFALLFAIIGYAAAEMLLTKSLKFWKNYKGFLCYLLVCVVISGAVAADPLGFTEYVPESGEIKMAYLNFETSSASVFRDAVGLGEPKAHYYHGNDGAVFEDLEGIESVRKLHKAVIGIPEAHYNDYVVIGYVLQNGKTVFRYFEANKYELDKIVSEVTKTEEYVNAKSPILRRERDNVSAVRVQLYSKDEEIMISDKEQIALLLDAMIADRASLGEAADYGAHEGYIQILKSDDKNLWYDFDLTESMTESYKALNIIKGDK